jgi:predicted phosphodiesterase
MTHRLSIVWPDARPFEDRAGSPIRILAISDVLEPTLTDRRNREAIRPVDLILGCGDLDFDDLAFVADAFDGPLVYVRGNHDSGASWERSAGTCPPPMPPAFVIRRAGLRIGGVSWPGATRSSERSELRAWRQSVTLATRLLHHTEPVIVISHVPPLGAGDVPSDPYHRGFRGYAWLMSHARPRLWLHGHTPLASARDWHVRVDGTDVVNVTGAVVIELLPPGSHELGAARTID